MVPLIVAAILLLAVLIAGALAACALWAGRAPITGGAGAGAADAADAAFANVKASRAAPLEVRTLHLASDRWKFTKARPKGKTPGERIYFIKRAIRLKTYFSDETRPVAKPVMPAGFRVWTQPAAAAALLPDARREIAALFEREMARPVAERYPSSDQLSRGLYYVFTRPVEAERVTYDEAMTALRADFPALGAFCHEYLRHLARIYGLEPAYLSEKTQLVLLRYEPKIGVWLHIDNITRYDRGPIATVSLGPPEVTYDFTPSLSSAGVPIRVRMREGDLAVMDGRSRMEWAHGLPYGLDAYKYTVMLKCDHITDNIVGYQPVLRTEIYEAIPASECSECSENGESSSS